MRKTLSIFAVATMLGTPSFGQSFGSAVAVSGDQVIAGGRTNVISPGALYLYEMAPDGSWAETSSLAPAEGGEAGDNFGRAISIDDRTMAVGAAGTNSVFLFEKGGDDAWSQVGRLQENDLEGFGFRVAMSKGHLLVAATGGDDSPGSVHAYQQVDGQWESRGVLHPDSASEIENFPSAMAIDGAHAVLGASTPDEGAGAAWAFKFNSETSSWEPNGSPSAPFVLARSAFGSSVLITDGHMAIGMPGHDRRIGAVAAFELSESSGEWSFTSRLSPFAAGRGSAFGSAMAIGGGSFYVGAPGAEGGAIYEFQTGPDGVTGLSKIVATGLNDRARFGSTVAIGENVAIVGAAGQDNRWGVAVPFETAGATWTQGPSVHHDPEGYASITGGKVACEDDTAGAFPCKDVDMASFLNLEDLGADRGMRMNDLWGWEDPETGREYALVGFSDQTSFVDVTEAENPVYLGRLKLTEGARPAVWRDIKVYRDHAYIVADGANQHGIQIFDLRQLRAFDGVPVEYQMTAYYDQIASAHNIVINEETGFAYVVGSSAGGRTCGGGLHMIDLSEPASPVFAGCFSDGNTGRGGTGYSHDAQCVVYHGPDSAYAGREICLGSNETALSIADVTDKENPVSIAIASYPNVAYAHQGWLTDDHRYFYMNDEIDEATGLVEGTRTLIWDLEDLDEPLLAAEHVAETTETDHNLYVKGNLMYQSNTGAGVRILDISDPTAPNEVGFFDTAPVQGSGGGTWSNYPYFKSGNIVVTGGFLGLFIVRKKEIDT